MATPDPLADAGGRRELRQIHRLRIVHEDVVSLKIQPLGVLAVHLYVQVEVARLERHWQSLDSVMKRLRHSIEVRWPTGPLPSCVDTQLPHHGDHPPEDFGNAASSPRGIDVDDSLANESQRQLPEALDLLGAAHFFVSIEQL